MVQDNELSPSKEKSNRGKLFRAGKLLITLLVLSYIFKTFNSEQKGINDIGKVFQRILIYQNAGILLLTFFLVPANWALESLKWRQLANKVVKISFRDAFHGTLTGLAVGVAAPAQLGDTIGRIAVLKSDNRLEAIGAALISNGIQFYISVFAGAIGWFCIGDELTLPYTSKVLLNGILLLILAGGWVGIIFRKRLTHWEPSSKYTIKIHNYIKVIGLYTASDLLLSTLFGTIRYLVFLVQFLLIFSLFDFNLTQLETALCITLIFLAKTLIPAVNVLGDLGFREFTALFVFKHHNLPVEEIITATFLIWILNVLGPILIGIFLMWKHKFKNISS